MYLLEILAGYTSYNGIPFSYTLIILFFVSLICSIKFKIVLAIMMLVGREFGGGDIWHNNKKWR